MKLFAADYDGTLNVGGKVSGETLRALRAWTEAGNLFVIDTGRSLESIRAESEKWDLYPAYYITNNGGMVFRQDGTELFSSAIDTVMSLDIMYIAHEVGNVVSYVANDGIYRHRVIVDKNEYDRRYPSLDPDLEEEEVMDLERHAQIVVSMTSTEEARILAERIRYHFPGKVEAYSNKYVVDVVPYGVSKATGLAFLCDMLGIAQEDIYTAGDADNDIPLMEFSLHGMCMADSPEDIKQHAKIICSDVAEYLEKIM